MNLAYKSYGNGWLETLRNDIYILTNNNMEHEDVYMFNKEANGSLRWGNNLLPQYSWILHDQSTCTKWIRFWLPSFIQEEILCKDVEKNCFHKI